MIMIVIQKAYQVLSLMKTLFTVYQSQKTIRAMRMIFRVFDSGVKVIIIIYNLLFNNFHLLNILKFVKTVIYALQRNF